MIIVHGYGGQVHTAGGGGVRGPGRDGRRAAQLGLARALDRDVLASPLRTLLQSFSPLAQTPDSWNSTEEA